MNYCFLHFKDSITISLRKFNYFNYIIFKIYRSIVLLNTMNKILKSIMTIKFNYVAKKHDLFSKKHFESRKSTFLKHVLHYFLKIIHSIWIDKKIVSLLLLDVVSVFDNVFHFRLLHNLRKRRIKKELTIWINNFFSSVTSSWKW